MAVQVKGTTTIAEVDANNNLKVNTPTTASTAGFAHMASQVDAGTITGVRYYKEAEITDDYRLRVGVDNVLFNENFIGSAINTSIWQTTLNVMTNTVVSGFSQLNAGLNLASGSYAIQRTYRHFPFYKQFTTFAEMEIQFTTAPQSGSRCEWGFALAATTAAPTDGAFFRINEAGEFRCVINYNGAETQSGTLNFTSLVNINTTHTFLIYVGSTSATFWIDNIMVSEIDAPVGQASVTSSMNLPLLFRNINVSAVTTAQVLKVGNVSVVLADQVQAKPWGHTMSGMGGTALQGQTGGTLGSTALLTNSATAAAAALSNTSAAAQFIGLGGMFKVLPTLTAGTDGILCSYQNPVGTSTAPGKTLYITAIAIDGVVTTVFAGGPVIYGAGAAFGHTAVSLATTESATGKAPRRLALGMQSYVATAAVGAQGTRISWADPEAPLPVQPGEFFQITLRNFGTVTTTGDITFTVAVTGYWE